MNRKILLVIIVLFFTACKKKAKQNIALKYTMIFDELAHMYPPSSNIIKLNNAHSGQYVLITDTLNVYSQTFASKLSDISTKPITKVSVSGFIMAPSNLSNGAIVVSIEDSKGKHFEYGSITCKQFVKQNNVWEPFTIELPIKAASSKPDNIVKIYGWNYDSKDVTFFDDLTVTFEN